MRVGCRVWAEPITLNVPGHLECDRAVGEKSVTKGLERFVEDLNTLYRNELALWRSDYDVSGFYWIDCTDHQSSGFFICAPGCGTHQ